MREIKSKREIKREGSKREIDNKSREMPERDRYVVGKGDQRDQERDQKREIKREREREIKGLKEDVDNVFELMGC